MLTALRRASLVLGTGFVLFFFSETVFWALWRPGEAMSGRILAWLLYSLIGYLTMALIGYCRVSDSWALLLAGAFFGWIDEGVFAMTVFGDPSMPFPFTIAWTALAWHGPISLVLGWYWLGLALRKNGPGATLALSLGAGLFWGAWGFGWLAETPPVRATPTMFLLHSVVATGCLALGHLAVAAGRLESFRPSRAGVALASAVVMGFFVLVTAQRIAIAPLVMLPLMGVLALALARYRKGRDERSVFASFAAPIQRKNLCALAVLPLTASAVYAISTRTLPPNRAVNGALAAVTSVGGLALFLVALVRTFRRRTDAATAGV